MSTGFWGSRRAHPHSAQERLRDRPQRPVGAPGDDGDPVRIATTDAAGKYIFPETGTPNLINGARYFVREVVPQGWRLEVLAETFLKALAAA